MLVKISDESDRSFSTEEAALNWFCRDSDCSIDQVRTAWVNDSDMNLEGCADCKAVAVTIWSGVVPIVDGLARPSKPNVLIVSNCQRNHKN